MSILSSRSSLQRSAVVLFSVGAVVAALLAGAPTAGANAPGAAALAAAPSSLTSGRYIVMLREPAAATYSGGKSRYAATRSTTGSVRRPHGSGPRLHQPPAPDARHRRTLGRRDRGQRLHGGEQRLRRRPDLRAGPRAQQRPSGAPAGEVDEPQARHLAHPDLPRPDRQERRLDPHGGEANAGSGIVVADLDTGIWPESKSFAGCRAHLDPPKTKWDISRTGEDTRMEKSDGTVFRGRCVIAEGWDAGDCNTKIISARYYGDSFLAGDPELSEFEHIRHATATATAPTPPAPPPATRSPTPPPRDASSDPCRAWRPRPGSPSTRSAGKQPTRQQRMQQRRLRGRHRPGRHRRCRRAELLRRWRADPTLDAIELAYEGAAEAGDLRVGLGRQLRSRPDHARPPGALADHGRRLHGVQLENTVVLATARRSPAPRSPRRPSRRARWSTPAASAVEGADPDDASLCGPDTLDPAAVSGTIVVCIRGVYDRVAKSAEVKRAGGKAMVLVNPSPNSLDADFHSVPTIHLADTALPHDRRLPRLRGRQRHGVVQDRQPHQADDAAPQVAGFSSRGPVLVAGGDLAASRTSRLRVSTSWRRSHRRRTPVGTTT